MKKRNIYLIACMVSAVASINSYAAVIVSGPGDSISVSGTAIDTEVNGYRSTVSDSSPYSFTMTAGTVDVTSTFTGSAARGVYADSTTGGTVVNISGGTMTVSESGDKDAALIRMNDHEDSLTISGGIFNLTESGDGGAYGIRVIRDVPVNISGGTFNFSQDDSSVGGIFVGGGAAETTINLSGGKFNNLDQFDTHITLDDAAVMNIDVLSNTSTGLTYDENGVIQEASGTISGTLADGNAFSFNFVTLDARNQITVTGALSANLETPAELAMSHDIGDSSTTGTVDAVVVSETNMNVTITLSDQSDAGAFTVLSATPQTLTNETTELAFKFDNTVANLAFGETATGLVTFVWAETGGGASGTNSMAISATVAYPASSVYIWNGSSDGSWGTAANWEGEFGQAVVPVFDNTAVVQIAGTANLDQIIRTHSTVKSLTFTSSNTAATQIGLVAANGTADRDLIFDADSGNATLTVDALASGDKTLGTSGGALTPGEVVLTSDLDITHNGDGDLIFAAEIRGAGDLSIAGTGATVLSGLKRFTIGGDGTNNVITGSGTVNIDGIFSFDLTTAGTTVSDSWAIVDVDNLDETFGAGFTVDSFTDAGSDTWTLDIDGTVYQFSEITGTLTVLSTSSDYQAWIEGFGLSGAATNGNYDVEPDGLDNLMEYALGGNPTNDDAAVVSPKTYTADVGGTDYFYHVYDQRVDDAALTFTLGATDNLISTPADTNDVEFVGQSAQSGSFRTQTNRTEATPSAKFIQLKVQKD